MNPNNSQYETIKNHLLIHGSISSWEAITQYHITRLSQYILMLREDFEIDSIWHHEKGRRWVNYILKRKEVEVKEVPVGKCFQYSF